MVTDIAHAGKLSPSKLLLPLSYASMFGGTLTLIGTSTNILASDLSGRLINRPFTMFEFTELGLIVSVVGTVYLLTVGRYLVPSRFRPEDLTEEFEMSEYLTEVVVRQDSPLIGQQSTRRSEFRRLTWTSSSWSARTHVPRTLGQNPFEPVMSSPFGRPRHARRPPRCRRSGHHPDVEVDDRNWKPHERKNLVEVVVAPGPRLLARRSSPRTSASATRDSSGASPRAWSCTANEWTTLRSASAIRF